MTDTPNQKYFLVSVLHLVPSGSVMAAALQGTRLRFGQPEDGRGPDRMALGEGRSAGSREWPEKARRGARRYVAESHAVKIPQRQPGQCVRQDERTEQPDAGAQSAEIMGGGVIIGMRR